MIKEARNIDFSTTGRQPSEEDFARISDWIRKQKQSAKKPAKLSSKPVMKLLKDKVIDS